MQITLNTKPTDDPHDILVVASDATPVAPEAHADPITPTEEALSRLAQSLRETPVMREAPTVQALPEPQFVTGSIVPPVDTSFRPVADDVAVQTMALPPATGVRPLRGFAVALLFALAASCAAMAWQVFGDTAIQAATRWMPQHVLAALPLKPSVAAEPAPSPAVEASAAPAASPPPVVQAAEGAAPTAAAAADPAPSLRAMGQQIEELKASIEQLKASQQQMSRELAMATERTTEPNLAPRPPAPRPAVARARKPVAPAPTQTAAAPRLPPVAAVPAAAPYVPRQPEAPPPVAAQPQIDAPVSSAPRPPMPIQ